MASTLVAGDARPIRVDLAAHVSFVQKTTVIRRERRRSFKRGTTAGELPGRCASTPTSIEERSALRAATAPSDSPTASCAGRHGHERASRPSRSTCMRSRGEERGDASPTWASTGRRCTKRRGRGAVVYVVGAALGDTTSKQFWVERGSTAVRADVREYSAGPGRCSLRQATRRRRVDRRCRSSSS